MLIIDGQDSQGVGHKDASSSTVSKVCHPLDHMSDIIPYTGVTLT